MHRAGAIWPRYFWMTLLMAVFSGRLLAQNLFFIENDGKMERVRSADGDTAVIVEGGKRISFNETAHFSLQSTKAYLPVLITVRKPNFSKGARAISDNGTAGARLIHSGRFVFTATLESPRTLEKVILLLVLESAKDGRVFYPVDIGHIDAHGTKRVSIDQRTTARLRGVHLAGLHIFVDGMEALNSEIPELQRAVALDRMVADRVAKEQNAELQPLFVSEAVYPKTLKPRVKGKAIVTFHVDTRGAVVDPVVSSETDPAFGVAAIEALRQWRFVPRVRNGAAVESGAELPFVFDPPA
jgi:TonB family protein